MSLNHSCKRKSRLLFDRFGAGNERFTIYTKPGTLTPMFPDETNSHGMYRWPCTYQEVQQCVMLNFRKMSQVENKELAAY